jgi:hypothetical protein
VIGIGSRSSPLAALAVVIALAACTSKKQCPQGQTDCGGECVDLQTDTRHCGSCVSPASVCPTGATCEAGECHCPADRQDVCTGVCVNLQSDPGNCGACGHACGLGTCSGGACTCDTSPSTVTRCSGASPECVDVASDPRNCNGCGNACPLQNEQCVASACTCASPRSTECPTSNPTACVDVQTDALNCSECGHKCVENETCAGASCSCGTPYTWCGTGESRVCTNLQTDPTNCSQCGQVCGGGQTCVGGSCTCPSGKRRCSDICVDTQTDENNCGGCGNGCAAGESCAGGRCATLVCNGVACQGGTACCSDGACPLQHSNGLLQSYFHCHAAGTPGVPGTYTSDMALEAAKAWQPGGRSAGINCQCQAWLSEDGSLCGQWCYGDYLPGSGAVVTGGILSCGTCITPPGSFTWN